MSAGALKDAVRLGVMRGLALGRPMSDASKPGGYDATFLIDTIYAEVQKAMTPADEEATYWQQQNARPPLTAREVGEHTAALLDRNRNVVLGAAELTALLDEVERVAGAEAEWMACNADESGFTYEGAGAEGRARDQLARGRHGIDRVMRRYVTPWEQVKS